MNNLVINLNNYLISPLFLLLFVGGLIGIVTFIYLLRVRETPGVKYWLIWQASAVLWAITYAFEFAATDIETKIFWSKISYLGIVYCGISFYFFSLEFSTSERYPNKKLILALYSIATLLLVSPITNEFHHLHWRSYSINQATNATDYVYGPFFWVIFVFSYLTLIAGIANVILFYSKLSNYYRKQVRLLFFASLIPPLGNLIYVFQINPIPGFDWTPLSFLITGILIAISISKHKLFNFIPFARNKLIDIIPDAILIIDQSLRIADHNERMRELIVSNHAELIGQQIEMIFPNHEEIINQIIRQDEYQTEISVEHEGRKQYFDLQSSTLYDHHRNQTGRLIIIKDITRRIEAEESVSLVNMKLTNEIREKEKLIVELDAFSHTVAHDLKNMLGAIVSASSLIKTGIGNIPEEDILEINDLISQSAVKTMHITKELLTLASVRQQEVQSRKVQMGKIVMDSVARLKDMITNQSAQIILPTSWPDVLGYGSWLEEVWINYISNALKYGGNPPVIELGCEILDDGRIKFWVKDNGKGLSEDEFSTLFNKYTRLDPQRAEGNGLGLSIVKRIIEKLNGEVGVDSPNIPGQGCTFYFILPQAKS
jgi:PAS domain S-box-containing protein